MIMDQENITMNANPIVTFLQKPAASFTKADIINYIESNEIRMVNFMYPGGDGKLKTLNFVINDLDYLDTILTCGERVDAVASSHLSRQVRATFMYCPVSAQLSSIRLLRFQLSRCSVLISIRMAIPWSLRQSTHSIRQL